MPLRHGTSVSTQSTDKYLPVTQGVPTGPFLLRLADVYGNQVISTEDITISISSDNPDLSIRYNATGASLTSLPFPAGAGQVSFYILSTSNEASLTLGGPEAPLTLTVIAE